MLVSTFTTLREMVFELPKDFQHQADDNINQAIYQTLAYFDIFEYPLTGWEVYKYLWRGSLRDDVSFFAVRSALDNSEKVERKDGFYFLKGKENLIQTRKRRQVISAQKYRRAGKIIKWLSLLPFIEMIAVSNSLAYENARAESDIDLFIITAPGHIWTARFYAALLLKLFHLRPQGSDRADKFCLNFFVSTDGLDLQKLTLTDDIYFQYWIAQLYPVYDRARNYQDLIFANGWLKKNLSIERCISGRYRRVKNNSAMNALKSILASLNNFSFIELILQNIQEKKMPVAIKEKANVTSEVVINKTTLKFHTNDRRADYRDWWLGKLKID
ncbi:MAG: hypothetical protein Q8Q23_01415 [bacterium]|nr:hypothetical protein [bacterium]